MRVFIDTAPFIYLIENHPTFAEKVTRFFAKKAAAGHEIMTSVVTIMEFGVKPERDGRHEVIRAFENMLDRLKINIINIDESVAKRAYVLRANYPALKGMDSLQLAAAIEENCKEFFTNDRKLKQVSEINIIIVEDLV